MPQPSFELPVKMYRNILIWPLLLRGNPAGDELPLLARWSDVFRKVGWVPNDSSKLERDGRTIWRVPAGNPYEEVVYFHPFVRDFLYGDGKTDPNDHAIHHLRHPTAATVKVTFTSFRFSQREEDVTLRLTVDRVDLYLCKPNVALFVVEVSRPTHDAAPDRPVTLGQILDFQDQFRRIYPPFWYDTKDNGDRATQPGLCVKAVDWFAERGAEPLLAHDCTAPAATFKEFTADGAEPPVFAHWRYFFGTVRPLRTRHDIDAGTLCYQQIMDERIPALSFVGVDDTSQITPGDYDRLTFFDAAGTDDFPYDSGFLGNTRDRFTYDRFAHYGTRYLFSGYGFSVVGNVGKVDGYSFFRDVLENHFRHHYFKLGLLAHYLRASLLGFADELSEATKALRGQGDAQAEMANTQFRKQVEEIQNRFLKFRSRSWFPEVSNQQQGGELHQKWFAQLNIDTLFRQVDETSDQLHAILAESESRQLSRSQAKLADEQHKLALVAYYGLGLSIVGSAMSAVFGWAALFVGDAKADGALNWAPLLWLMLGVLVGFGGWLWLKRRVPPLNAKTGSTPANSQ